MYAHLADRMTGGPCGVFQSNKGSNLSAVHDITSPIFNCSGSSEALVEFYVCYVYTVWGYLCAFFKSIVSQPPSSSSSPLLRALASGRKCVTARSSWTILRNVSHTHVRTHTKKNPGDMPTKGKTGDWREGEREWGWRDRREEWKEKEKRDLGLHSRLGRPGRTNVFDSQEMNFPAVVTTAAKYVKPSLQSPDHSTSKTDKILGKYFIWELFEGSLTEVSQGTLSRSCRWSV